MLTAFAAALIPLVTACQIVALGLLWRRYRMPGAGWWLLATIFTFIGTAGQALLEYGWRPYGMILVVFAFCLLAPVLELVAAQALDGAAPPDRGRLLYLGGFGLAFAALGAWRVDQHPGSAAVFGVLITPALLMIGVAQGAVIVSLIRLSRRSGSSGGLIAATGYVLLTVALPTYPVQGHYPWLRTAGMANAAFAYLLVTWGLLMFLLERRNLELLAETETLQQAVSDQAARAEAFARQAQADGQRVERHSDQVELGAIAVALAQDLLSSVSVLRHSSLRLHGGSLPGDREALTERIEGVLHDLAMAATGVLAAGGPDPGRPSRVDARKMLERLLTEMVPPTIGVMKAWPAPQVWLLIDETLLSVALHQLIRCQLTAEPPVTRLSIIVSTQPGVSVTLQQVLSGKGTGGPPADALGLRLAHLAIRRLGGQLDVRPGPGGTALVMTLPSGVADPMPATRRAD